MSPESLDSFFTCWGTSGGLEPFVFRKHGCIVKNELEIGKTGAEETSLEAVASNRLGEEGGKSALDQFG